MREMHPNLPQSTASFDVITLTALVGICVRVALFLGTFPAAEVGHRNWLSTELPPKSRELWDTLPALAEKDKSILHKGVVTSVSKRAMNY